MDVWRVKRPTNRWNLVDIVGDDGLVASIHATKNQMSNARLIAAAPDTTKALRDLLKEYIGLVSSGDCGFWDYEKDIPVINARKALARV